MSGVQGSVGFALTVAGQAMPVMRVDVTSGAYGSAGHLTAETSIKALSAAGVDLYGITAGAPAPPEVALDVTLDGGGPVRAFGGEHFNTRWDYDADTVQIHARDWAGQLVDQRRVPTTVVQAIEATLAPLAPGQTSGAPGPSSVNQTVGQIVSAIAAEFGLTPVLNMSGPAGNPGYGTVNGSTDATFVTVPQSNWEILNLLARDTGYEVYVTPDKRLVFGVAGAGLSALALSWNTNPVPPGAVPARALRIEHQPRRNATFRVLVLSYDPAKAQQTTGRATVVSGAFADTAGLKPGIWTGNDALTADATLANQQNVRVPLYTFRHDGLTTAQVAQRALAVATDIARRELALSVEIDGLPDLLPTTPLTLSGPVASAFAGNQWYVTGYRHRFQMRANSPQAMGFLTEIRALDLPVMASGGGPLAK